jgi:hypothetical protein
VSDENATSDGSVSSGTQKEVVVPRGGLRRTSENATSDGSGSSGAQKGVVGVPGGRQRTSENATYDSSVSSGTQKNDVVGVRGGRQRTYARSPTAPKRGTSINSANHSSTASESLLYSPWKQAVP